MKKFFVAVTFLVLGSVTFFSCAGTKGGNNKFTGKWQGTPITIDGSNLDWPSPYSDYDVEAGLGYMVTNDKDNLYITVETGDAATQLKILREGLTVWIDKTGEKEEKIAINYPLPNTGSTRQEQRQEDRPQGGTMKSALGDGDGARLDLVERVKALLPAAHEYSLEGFKRCNGFFPIAQTDTCGVMVRIGLDDQNELVWEAVVPFKSFYFKPQIGRMDMGRPISIAFETTGLERPKGTRPAGGRGGGMRPSMGFGMGGMRYAPGGGYNGGGRAPQGSNIMEPAYKTTITWKRVGIAFQ